MAITEDWKIKSRAHTCSHTGKPFENEEEFHTAIFIDDETGEFVRKDFSEEAWQELRDSLQPFSFWKSVYEVPVVEEKREVVEKESAEGMLRRLIEENEAHTENARYILALMLERKKILRPTDTQFTAQRKLLIYEHGKTGEVFIVADPELHLDEVERVQTEVANLLAGRDRRPETESHEPDNDATPAEEAQEQEAAEDAPSTPEEPEATRPPDQTDEDQR